MLVSLLASCWIKRYNLDKDKMWRQMIDHKYNTQNPNIFCSNTSGSSNFFNVMMSAALVAKMGYKWRIGNGKKVKFWEDN